MVREIIIRDSDTCPACGKATVWAGIETAGVVGPVWIDGCASCLALWERETRARPTKEPCSNCAWLPGSRESKSGELIAIEMSTIYGPGIFYCHRRVPFKSNACDIVERKDTELKTHGFDHKINAAGTRVTNATVCAGWLKAKLRAKAEPLS